MFIGQCWFWARQGKKTTVSCLWPSLPCFGSFCRQGFRSAQNGSSYCNPLAIPQLPCWSMCPPLRVQNSSYLVPAPSPLGCFWKSRRWFYFTSLCTLSSHKPAPHLNILSSETSSLWAQAWCPSCLFVAPTRFHNFGEFFHCVIISWMTISLTRLYTLRGKGSLNCELLAHFPWALRNYLMVDHTSLMLSNGIPQKFVRRLLNYIGKIFFFNLNNYDLVRMSCFSLLSK